jgi:L-lactate dehydrogenase (cytochrome)
LEEVTAALRRVNAPSSFEVLVDGGIRRGSDIFKAIALGAKAVGIGRPALYGLAAYGQDGVERVIEILLDELKMCMALMGVSRIDQINSNYVITRNLPDHVANVPKHHLMNSTYETLQTQMQRSRL